jgi:hypothetical protein
VAGYALDQPRCMRLGQTSAPVGREAGMSAGRGHPWGQPGLAVWLSSIIALGGIREKCPAGRQGLKRIEYIDQRHDHAVEPPQDALWRSSPTKAGKALRVLFGAGSRPGGEGGCPSEGGSSFGNPTGTYPAVPYHYRAQRRPR